MVRVGTNVKDDRLDYDVFAVEMSPNEVDDGHFEDLVHELIHYKLFITELNYGNPFQIHVYRYEGGRDSGDKTVYFLKTSSSHFLKRYLKDYEIRIESSDVLRSATFVLTI